MKLTTLYRLKKRWDEMNILKKVGLLVFIVVILVTSILLNFYDELVRDKAVKNTVEALPTTGIVCTYSNRGEASYFYVDGFQYTKLLNDSHTITDKEGVTMFPRTMTNLYCKKIGENNQ